jgi:hypothetical protein
MRYVGICLGGRAGLMGRLMTMSLVSARDLGTLDERSVR